MSARDYSRERRIVLACLSGETFPVVARREGITGERVRQVVKRWEQETGVHVLRCVERQAVRRTRRPPPRSKRTLAQRLAEKCERVGDCWIWTGGFGWFNSNRVYPVMGWGTRAARSVGQQYAHRVAYVLWNGPISQGAAVKQMCGAYLCINPAHLTAVSEITCPRCGREFNRGAFNLHSRFCRTSVDTSSPSPVT